MIYKPQKIKINCWTRLRLLFCKSYISADFYGINQNSGTVLYFKKLGQDIYCVKELIFIDGELKRICKL